MQKKNFLAIFAFLTATLWLPAQITVTNAVFPAAGDSLKTATDLEPDGIVITPAGGPYTWDFSTLSPTTRQVTTFQPATEGMAFASFSNAELVTIAGVGSETYYDVTATSFSTLGISGSDLAQGLPIEALLVFTPPLPELNAPLSFPNVFTSQTSFGFAIAVSEIPGGILDSLGVPSGFLDSIRIQITTSRNDFVDAYGSLTIPGGTYDVLRSKRTDYNDARLEIHVPFFGWQDITELVGIGGFGQDTTISFSFYSNTAKEPIAIIIADSTGLIAAQVEYKDNGVTSATNPMAMDQYEVTVSPNPVMNYATFELKDNVSGQNTIHFFDSNAQRVMVRDLASDRVVLSLQSLSPGIYLFNVVDINGHTIGTGKLMKAK